MHETAEAINESIMALLAQLGRTVGAGGGRGPASRSAAFTRAAGRARPFRGTGR